MIPAKKLLPIVIVLAVLLRLFYLAELSRSPFFRHPVLDAQYYSSWAQKLAWGNFRPGPEYRGNPLYAYFLAAVYRLGGVNPYLVRIVQHVLGIVTCLLVYRCGAALFSPATGLIAAFLYGIYVPGIFLEGFLLSASLEAFLTVALLSALLFCREKPEKGNWLLTGLLAGLLFLARPSLIPLGALIWIIAAFPRPDRSTAISGAGLFLLGTAAVVAAYSSQYYFSRRELVFVSPHGGENFYIGNNPEASGVSKMPAFSRGSPPLQHDDFQSEAERRMRRKMTPAAASRFWFRQGLRFIAGHPLDFLRLLARKIFFFFSGADFSDNYPLEFFRNQFPILGIPFSWRLLSTLGLLGLAIATWRGKEQSLLLAFIFTYVLSISLFFITSRFRQPIAPLLCLTGAAGIVSLCDQARKRGRIRVIAALALGALLFILFGRPGRGVSPYSWYVAAGEVSYRDKDYDRAFSYLDKAREESERELPGMNWRTYRVYLALGEVQLARGNQGNAEAIFNRLASEGDLPGGEIRFEIGNAFADNKLYEEAVKRYRASLQEQPGHFRALNNLALAYKSLGETDKAEESFQEALRANPDYAPAHANLGNLYSQEGKYEAAAAEFQSALKLDPGLAHLHLSLAYCLQNLNQLAQAQEEYRRCPAVLRRTLEKKGGR